MRDDGFVQFLRREMDEVKAELAPTCSGTSSGRRGGSSPTKAGRMAPPRSKPAPRGDRTRQNADRRARPKSTPPHGPKVVKGADGKLVYEASTGISMYDPVLCELVYRWFCPPGGLVLDPFAGGCIGGIVAAKLGRRFLGIDVRPEQVAANRAQAARICADDATAPVWLEGDAIEIARLVSEPVDLVWSCPPYGDLEVYSEDERDISTLDYPVFLAKYRAIIAAAVAALKPDRFAAVVVGDFRDKEGFYRRFVSATEQAFEDAGARLYNEAVLVTAVGSLPIRVGIMFDKARKLGKTHQNVLIFVKGKPAAAAAAVGPVERGELLGAEAAPDPAVPDA